MSTTLTFLLVLLTLFLSLSRVSAHGYVSEIAIDGKWYAGNQPNNYKGKLYTWGACIHVLTPLQVPVPSVWCLTSVL